MALKLLDIAGRQEDPIRRSYVEMFARSTPLLGAMQFEDAPRGFTKVEREVSLGSADFRRINEGYTASEGKTEMVTFECKPVGGDVDIDKAILRRQGDDARAETEARKAKAVIHKVDYTLVNGDEDSTGGKEFNGFKTLVTGTAQDLENASGGGALSLIKLDEAIEMCTNPTHLYMTRKMKIRLSASTRSTGVSGYLRHDRDDFGRQIAIYNDIPILIADPAGHNNIPLDFTEGAGTDETSIYVLNLSGDEESLTGIQLMDLDYEDVGRIDNKPVMRTAIEWDLGIQLKSPRAVVRLSAVTDAAVTA